MRHYRPFIAVSVLILVFSGCMGEGGEQASSPEVTEEDISTPEIVEEEVVREDGAWRVEIDETGSLQNPAWSPDGKSLLFTRFREGYNEEPADLFVVPVDDNSSRILVSDGSGNINLPGSSWNPTTGKIVFASTREPHDEIFIIDSRGSSGDEVKITDREGLVAYEPSLSPEGDWVVFESHQLDVEENGIITKYKLDGSNSYEPLTGGNDDCRQPNWSPTGDLILYQKYADGRWDIWVMKTDGTDHRKVTSGPGDKTDASFSPQGDWIVYSSDEGELEYANLFIIPITGATPVRVTNYNGYDGAPSWSQDGTRIAFESSPGDPDDSDGTTIWIIDVPEQVEVTAPEEKTVPSISGGEPPTTTAQIETQQPDKTFSQAIWKPPVKTTFQWDLTDNVDQSVDAEVYDIDLFENDKTVVDALHAKGRKVICYISVGSWEDWRPDKDRFPDSVIGKDYRGWSGEKWLDIRQIDLLAPIMRARFDECKEKGFDAIEPDNIDGYLADSGFPLTYDDQIKYNKWLADEAHARGLSIGLKNDDEQVLDLLPYYDWALTEDCIADNWCEQVAPFVQAGKPVFMTEYTDKGITLEKLCDKADELNFNGILKNRDLDAWREAC